MKPTNEGFFWYKNNGWRKTVVETERRPDTGELYAFVIGFIGGTPVASMTGEWLGEVK